MIHFFSYLFKNLKRDITDNIVDVCLDWRKTDGNESSEVPVPKLMTEDGKC